MSGLDHNTVIRFLGACECPCHTRRKLEVPCWCHGDAPHPYRIHHNDAVANLGACPLRFHVDCRVRTEPVWARAFDEHQQREQDRRINRGLLRSGSDLNRAIRTGRYPFSRRPR